MIDLTRIVSGTAANNNTRDIYSCELCVTVLHRGSVVETKIPGPSLATFIWASIINY